MDSVPPSGDDEEDYPYPEESEEEEKRRAVFSRIAGMATGRIRFWMVSSILGLIFFRFTPGAIFTIYVMILIVLAIWRSRGKDGLTALMKRRWKWVVPLALCLPIFLPPLLAYYQKIFWTDWSRIMDRSPIYYIWNADSTVFGNPKDQEKLGRWNPGTKENEAVRAMLLAAAQSVGIDADRLLPFSPTLLQQDQPFTLVVFETISPQLLPPAPGEKNPPPPALGRLQVYFITPATPAIDEPTSKKVDAGSPLKKKQEAVPAGEFNMISMYAPQNLDIRFDFLTEGFHLSTGRPVDFKFLGEFIKLQESKGKEGSSG